MPLVINSNVAALNSQRQLSRSGLELSSAMERLSSGRRINSAADDAAGLVLSNRMTSQINGLNRAVSNANDGISLIQTAEGALDESTAILQRVRELSIQAANGIYRDADRVTLDAEVQQLISELDRISDTTSFNGKNILDGSQSGVSLHVGADAYQTVEFSIPSMDTGSLGLDRANKGLSGAELNLNLSGLLNESLGAAAVKINGQALAGVAAGASLQTLLDAVNDIKGVSVSSVLELAATTVGDGVLLGGDSVTITGIGADGTSQSYTLSNSSSLDELVASINAVGGENLSAGVDDNGQLVLTSERWAKVSVADTSGGSATGFDVSTIEDPDIAATIDGLNRYWVSEAENLISTFFGIEGDTNGTVDLTLNLEDSDGVGGSLASVSWLGGGALGTNLMLNLDMADFTAANLPNGGNAPFYNDRVIAHEMVHAVMTRITDMSALPGWFTEGAAELIHGADERVEDDFANLDAADGSELLAAFKTTPGSPATSEGYSASYLATKFLHDDSIANGGGGITALFARLEAGDSLDTALGHTSVTNGGATTWNSLASFEAHFLANGVDYLNEVYAGGNLDLFDGGADTGSIAGSDYGNPAETAISILDNALNTGSQNFNLIIPAEYAGTSKSASARLVIADDLGDAVSITVGAAGDDGDLENLGFREMSAAGLVLGEALSLTQQAAALGVGDLLINGVGVGAVEANAGLIAKVEAINSVSDESGVTASVQVQHSLSLDLEGSTEYTTAGAITSVVNGGVLGLNGVGLLVNVGDSATDIAASINAITFAHGVTAYADDVGRLHMQADGVIVLGANPTALQNTDLQLADSGALGTGSIEINGAEVSLNDIDDVGSVVTDINTQSATTGVRAAIDDNGQLQLRSSASIQLALGNTNGLMSFQALGISVGTDTGFQGGTNDLQDTDNDNLLGDETFTIRPRIFLDSANDRAVSLQLTANGESATGLSGLNEGSAAFGGASLSRISVSSQSAAQDAIGVVDLALDTINNTRSELGAVNNRLEFTVSNLMNIAENTSAARARITDADFAAETAKLSRAQVLQQAAQAMLAQANSQPQQIMQLLR